MKNYKYLVLLVLIVLFGASFYMLYDTKAAQMNLYKSHLEEARDYRKQGINVDAERKYKDALAVKPSLELYLEIGDFYSETGNIKLMLNWGDTVIKEYPKAAESYEMQMEHLIDNKDYAACYVLYEKFLKRKIESVKIERLINSIEYEHYFNGEYTDVGIFSGGLCSVLAGDKWGYVNTQGDKKVATKFAKVGNFSGGLSPVVDKDGEAYYVDTDGNKKFVLLDVENVVELGFIENGIYSVYNGETWSFYDKDYNKLFGDFEDASAIGNGIIAAKKDGKWTLLNRDGSELNGKKYEAVAMDEKQVVYRNDRIFVNDGSGYQMIDTAGNVYGDKKYQAVHIFNDTTYAAVMIDNQWGFVDASGKIVFDEWYEDARSFANGLAAVKKDGLWGYINTEGKMVIEPQFVNAKDFNDHGCAFVIRRQAWELLRLYKKNYN